MIVDYLSAKRRHQTIEGKCCITLEECVRLALAPHAIHYVVAIKPSIHHIIYSIDIILQVSINRHRGIAVLGSPSKSCPQGKLMSAVA